MALKQYLCRWLGFQFKVLFKTLLTVMILFSGLWAFGLENQKSFAVFGEDNRTEIYAAPSAIFELGRSVGGKISKEHLHIEGSIATLNRPTLGKLKCDHIRFSDQWVGPSCSGVIIGPDLLATAAHCVKTIDDCNNFYWVFDYALKNESDKTYIKIPVDNLYECQSIQKVKYADFGNVDFAVLKMKRPFAGRTVIKVDPVFQVEIGASVFMIGYPSGLPLKVTDQAHIKAIESPYSFSTDLDIFQGNSGSPVFESQTGTLIGLMSHGHEDYQRDPAHPECKIPRVCAEADHCHLSTATRISNLGISNQE